MPGVGLNELVRIKQPILIKIEEFAKAATTQEMVAVLAALRDTNRSLVSIGQTTTYRDPANPNQRKVILETGEATHMATDWFPTSGGGFWPGQPVEEVVRAALLDALADVHGSGRSLSTAIFGTQDGSAPVHGRGGKHPHAGGGHPVVFYLYLPPTAS